MPKINKTPTSVTTTTGGKFQPFKTLGYVKTKNTNNYAYTEIIDGKKGPLNRPGTLTCKNFQFNIPTGSLVTKIHVYVSHSKVASNGKVCNIPAPKVTVLNGNTPVKFSTGKSLTTTGKAPTTSIKEFNCTFTGGWDYTLVNNTNFGVKIDYPTNASNDEGAMRVYYVYILLEYRSPNFALKLVQPGTNASNLDPSIPANTGYNGDDYTISAVLSNKNNTRTIPTMTVTAPAGLTLKDTSGNGTVTRIDNGVWTWTPSKIYGNSTVEMAFTFGVNVSMGSSTSYPIAFSISESIQSKTASYTGYIIPRPASLDEDTSDTRPTSFDDDTEDPVTEIITIDVDTEIDYTFTIDDDTWDDIIQDIYEKGIQYEWWEGSLEDNLQTILNDFRIMFYSGVVAQQTYLSVNHKISRKEGSSWSDQYTAVALKDFVNKSTQLTLKGTSTGYDEILISVVNPVNLHYTPHYSRSLPNKWKFDIKPKDENLTTPNMAILTLTDEELDRLGDKTPYIIQTTLKQVTSETYSRNWGKNFRIGVFNNPILDNVTVVDIPDETEESGYREIVVDSTDYDSLTPSDIFNYADYWSNPITNVNTYTNLECKFAYNKNYPLYVIITGDYPEGTPSGNTIQFAEPCIIEDNGAYNGYEVNGTYPIPIDNTVLSDGNFAELNINPSDTSTPLIYYDLPFDEDYGTDENIAIRGLEVTGVIEQNTDDLNIYAKLITPKGESRIRSVNLDANLTDVNGNNTFSLGGSGDLWGLSTLEIVNLEDWEIEFMIDNTINPNTGTINYADVSLIVYFNEIDTQNIQCKVNGEDITYYGAFLTDAEIPEGLKTETKYIDVDGTDTNTPYLQNIKSKEITITLDVGDNCGLEASTLTLRDLARLFVNKRDQYDRPIPKTIEFSHYPDLYWEYILEDTFDNSIEISSYEVKIKLKIPSGTAYKKTPTTSNKYGYVNGLAAINPTITIKPTNPLITITETLTKQNFHIGYPEDIADKIMVIDCENRTVYLKNDEDDTGTEITSYVDFNSDWFNLYEDYQFDVTGATIKEVRYTERW